MKRFKVGDRVKIISNEFIIKKAEEFVDGIIQYQGKHLDEDWTLNEKDIQLIDERDEEDISISYMDFIALNIQSYRYAFTRDNHLAPGNFIYVFKKYVHELPKNLQLYLITKLIDEIDYSIKWGEIDKKKKTSLKEWLNFREWLINYKVRLSNEEEI